MKKMREGERKVSMCVFMRPETIALIDEIRGEHSRSATVEAMLHDYLGLPEDVIVDSYAMSRMD